MDVRIGIKDIAREVSFETKAAADEVSAAVKTAIADGSLLELEDEKGSAYLVPGDAIRYVELGGRSQRPVGFAQS